LPTKTEQADLLQCLFGRNGECPVPVVAARSPADCFDAAREAWRIASCYMTPVFLLSDGYIANGAEPWQVPSIDSLERIPVEHPKASDNGKTFEPYARNERLARPWALPGTPGLMHRLGGLEKQDVTGNVNYEPENHQHMVDLRARKVAGIASDIPAQEVDGPQSGKLLVVSWGGTYGAVATAARQARSRGASVAHVHLRYLNPLPANLGEIIGRFEQVLVPELNKGQLLLLLRARFLVDAVGLNKVQGKPFAIGEVLRKIESLLA
jgi:2-oxoglutarate ferredoxin oxidoreductase subunit alpha